MMAQPRPWKRLQLLITNHNHLNNSNVSNMVHQDHQGRLEHLEMMVNLVNPAKMVLPVKMARLMSAISNHRVRIPAQLDQPVLPVLLVRKAFVDLLEAMVIQARMVNRVDQDKLDKLVLVVVQDDQVPRANQVVPVR